MLLSLWFLYFHLFLFIFIFIYLFFILSILLSALALQAETKTRKSNLTFWACFPLVYVIAHTNHCFVLLWFSYRDCYHNRLSHIHRRYSARSSLESGIPDRRCHLSILCRNPSYQRQPIWITLHNDFVLHCRLVLAGFRYSPPWRCNLSMNNTTKILWSFLIKTNIKQN